MRLALNLLHVLYRKQAVILLRVDQPVANPLMWAAVVVVRHELLYDMVEVREPKDDEVIERFVLEALNPAFDERVQVRRPQTDRFDRDATLGECPIDFGRVLAVVVTDDGLARQLLSLGMRQKRPHLGLHPDGIRSIGCRGYKHPTGGDMADWPT